MHKFLLFLTLYSVSLFSQVVISGRVASSAYSFERFDSIKNPTTYVRGYQQAQLNASYSSFSFHTAINFENAYLKSLEYDSRLRVYNLYVEGTNLWNCATVKLGRQPIFSGLAGGTFDGLGLKLSGYTMIFEGYAGGNLPAYQKLKLTDDFKNNNILALKLRVLPIEGWTFGVGFVSKNINRNNNDTTGLDEPFNPIFKLIKTNSSAYQFLNGEVLYEKENKIYARSSYEFDMNLFKTSKIEVEAETPVVNDIDIVVYGNYREPRVRYNSIFSVFDYGNTKEAEAGLSYHLPMNMIVSGRFGYTNYKDESSSRINLSLTGNCGSLNLRKTFGYAGEMNSITLSSGHTYFDGLITPSASIAYTGYKLSKDSPLEKLITLIAGCNIRPYNTFSIDLQGQYLDNKFYKNDMRFLLKLNYWFHSLLK